MTKFKIVTEQVINSTDHDTVEQYCMSVFGSDKPPGDHIKVTIVKEAPAPAAPAAPKAADGQAAKPAAK